MSAANRSRVRSPRHLGLVEEIEAKEIEMDVMPEFDDYMPPPGRRLWRS
jgi:hypothetical protein